MYAEGLRDFMIDDSGLFVDALKGFPGVYSAYGQKTIGNEGILKLMEGVDDRAAVFKCCIGCRIGDETVIVTGKCPGVTVPEGTGDSDTTPSSAPTENIPSPKYLWRRRTSSPTEGWPPACWWRNSVTADSSEGKAASSADAVSNAII